jgi:membrane glycosyltransferase
LRATGSESRFHLFVLSDTTDAAIRLKEEQTWAEMTTRLGSTPRLFYRHRRENTGRKAGNIAEFCSRWGADYKYMAVLDADSLMSGATLVEMVRRMERDPGLGILQAPPVPVNRQSLFGRLQQFAAQAYGAVFLEGYALWSQCDGNYWGHNAVIRVRPFMKHCDLPVLPGDGPLGGEILSHDFVEAALMRRAGWKVCLAHDLAGSYEECPATLLAFAQRDQRWCQGNLQHLRLLMAEGFHPASRLHLGMGAMSYLSSPLWFAFLMLSLTSAFVSGVFRDDQSTSGLILFAVSLALLLLPKLWGVLALRAQASPPEIQSVWRKIGVGVLLEVAASMLVAPIMMLFHSRFVVSTLLGKKVVWNTQHRGDGKMHLAEAVAVHWGHTLIGLMIGLVTYWRAPQLLPWLMPIILGLVTSIPLTMLLGSVRVGRALAERGLLLIPEEVNPPEVIQRQVSARREIKTTRNSSDRDDPLLAMLADPAQFQLHVGIIRATGCEAPVTGAERNLIVTAADIPPQLRRAVLDDLSLLESLHVGVRARMTQCAGA